MRSIKVLSLALAAAAALSGGSALANVCQADNNLWCATAMPVGGYCECSAHGQTAGGSVIAKAPAQTKINSTAGGCGSNPNAPGCRR